MSSRNQQEQRPTNLTYMNLTFAQTLDLLESGQRKGSENGRPDLRVGAEAGLD